MSSGTALRFILSIFDMIFSALLILPLLMSHLDGKLTFIKGNTRIAVPSILFPFFLFILFCLPDAFRDNKWRENRQCQRN